MPLVAYSDSDDDDEAEQPVQKRNTHVKEGAREHDAPSSAALPPLPSAFHDLYSASVRTSTADDPALHGGRKRVTPHVAGHWPTHVYLEWQPSLSETERLSELIAAGQDATDPAGDGAGESTSTHVHSLLTSELGVALPLHVSLSRPLTLKTEQKAAFLDQLTASMSRMGVTAFVTRPAVRYWHPNESQTRWFLVLGLEQSARRELPKLLAACNETAAQFGQPLLYQENEKRDDASFHISIAWSLQAHDSSRNDAARLALPQDVRRLEISFSKVKVRIGQDVTTIPLARHRQSSVSSP